MRIGIDCRTILNPEAGEKAGIANYTYHLVKNLLEIDKTDEFVLFFDERAREVAKEFLAPNSVTRYFTLSRYRKYLPFVYSHVLTAMTLAYEKLDLFHSPANIAPMRYGGNFVVTVHDLAIYREPGMFPSGQGFSIKYLVPRSIVRAKKIIAVSESTKKDIIEFFNVDPNKISVIYEGVDHNRFPFKKPEAGLREYLNNAYHIKRDYILFVGTLEPRKNLIRLLEAWYKLVNKKPSIAQNYQLVLAGGAGWLYDAIYEEVKNRNLESSVLFPGYFPSKDLPKLYAGAAFFIFPSLYEGFGLPVLEAMASGLPVITSNVSALPEIAGQAAILIDPHDEEGIAAAMEKLLDKPELRLELAAAGQARAQQFTWRKCAQETLQLYREIK